MEKIKKSVFVQVSSPFTEPSVEVDVSWGNEDDEENIKWLEILGAGMVHPNVLKMAGFDPEVYSGLHLEWDQNV